MPRVFISYSSVDRGFVEQLIRDLQANGITPWYDQWEMIPGESLTWKIGNAILDNDRMVTIMSPNSVASEWVQRELGVALEREFRERSVQVIPALIEDCTIPAFLRDKVYADFRSDYRKGLHDLLRAVGWSRVESAVVSNLPDLSTAHIVWGNVVGTNIRTENIAR